MTDQSSHTATYGEIRSDPDFRWERIHDKTELEAFYRRIIPTISAAAREYGYAIGVHGSLQRDLDLIAAPWREGACDHETLARVVHKAACGLVSESYTWEVKPGGRYACSFPVCWTEKSETFKRETSLGCIDLSVMPFVTLSEKAMSKIVEASAPQIEEAARNMAKAAVIGVGVGPLPSALSAEVRRFQGGLTNAQLAEAWEKKLPGVTPTDRELSAFAIGIEVGETLTRSATAATSLDQVNELLAILNGDGGHRRAAVGQQQAAKEAIEKVLRMMQLLAENDLLERLASDSGKADK